MQWILFLLIFSFSLFANDDTAIITLANDPSTLVAEKVNVITGEPAIASIDILIQGKEPIPIWKTYFHNSHQTSCSWQYLALFGFAKITEDDLLLVVEKNGLQIEYQFKEKRGKKENRRHHYEPVNLGAGYTNTSQGAISSRTNLKNQYVDLQRDQDWFEVICPDGTVRKYEKFSHEKIKKGANYRLVSEKLPNGNWLLYEYEQQKKLWILKTIRSTNPSQKITYAKADFIYSKDRRKIIGSDGTNLTYRFSEDLPTETIYPSAPNETYTYKKYKNTYEKKFAKQIDPQKELRLGGISHPLQRTVQFDYYTRYREPVAGQTIVMNDALGPDPRRNRVKTLSSPVGRDATLHVTHTFLYDPDHKSSTVYDAEGNKTDYTWDEGYRLLSQQRYSKEGQLLNEQRFEWGEDQQNGMLLCKTLLDADRIPFSSIKYTYDLRGNIRSEEFTGKELGRPYTKSYRYTNTIPNLLQEETDHFGMHITYTYHPGTDLLQTKCIYDGPIIKHKTTWTYNEDLILIREMTEEPQCCLIKQITPVSSGPYVGMPQIIEEKYLEHGREKLLSKMELHYTNGGKIRHKDIYDSNGIFQYQLTYDYDEKGRLKSSTNAIGQQATFETDECFNLIKETDDSGRTSTHTTYDYSNRPIRESKVGDDQVVSDTTYVYNLNSQLISTTDDRGQTIQFQLDPLGRALKTIYPHATLSASYDPAGNPKTQTDGEGNTTETTYNAYGKPTQIIHPDNATEQFEYFPNGNLKSHKDTQGVTTRYEYDYLNRLIKKTVLAASVTWVYSGTHLIEKVNPEGGSLEISYDFAGRKSSETFGGEKTLYTYDSLSRVETTQKGSLLTIAHYDLLNRIIEEKADNEWIRNEYDRAGNISARIKQNGKERFEYDSLGRLIWHQDPLGHTDTTTYKGHLEKTHVDSQGLQTIETLNQRGLIERIEKRTHQTLHLEEKTYNKNNLLILNTQTIFTPKAPPRIVQTKWEYTPRNQLQRLTESYGTVQAKTTHYTYTPRGELETITKPDGTQLQYTHDPYGHLTKIVSSDGTVHHRMTYNLLGQLLSTDGIVRKLDPHGRIIQEIQPTGLSLQNTYNNEGKKITTTIPHANCHIEYTHSPLHLIRITRKTLDTEQTLYSHTYDHYDPNGLLLQETTPLGSITRTHDSCSRPLTLQAPFFNQTITHYDSRGNITQMTRQNIHHTYTYDPLYQLNQETNHHYLYDSNYNRIQKDEETITIDNLNQDITHYTYDLNGNPRNQNEIDYQFDALDRLIRIQTPNHTTTYTYDSNHRRLTETTNQQTRYYLYDDQNEIGSFTPNLQPIDLRILGNTPHADIGAAIAIELADQVYIPIHDLQGNLALLLPMNHTEPTRYTYTAFGEETIHGTINELTLSPWRYSSKRTDPHTQLVYFGRRYYEPAHGRWLTPDPLGDIDHPNLYQYLYNNPFLYKDPTGTSITSCLLGLGEIILGSTLVLTAGAIEIATVGGYSIGASLQMSTGLALIAQGLNLTSQNPQDFFALWKNLNLPVQPVSMNKPLLTKGINRKPKDPKPKDPTLTTEVAPD